VLGGSEDMQTDSWDPLLFLVAFLCFLMLFLGYGYYNKLLWFQQGSAAQTDNWFVSFQTRDLASGGRFHRIGRPVIVLIFLNLITLRIVMYFSLLSPIQLFVFVFVFYIPTGAILTIILLAILWRIHKQSRVFEREPSIEDPFPDSDFE
jgi:uncharacterized membrane protein